MASTTAHLLLFFILTTSYTTSAESSNKKTTFGPQINVTKNLFFLDFNSNNATLNQDITLLGSAAISNQKGCIQVPEDSLPYSEGRAIYSSPIRLFDPTSQAPASFQTTFSFQFYSPSNISCSNSSGLSFIIASDEFTIGRQGPLIGTQDDACDDEYKAVAVILDARMNPELGHSKGKRRKKNTDETVVASELNVRSLMPPNRARKFSLAEISSVTQGFGQSQVLGSDSRSVTYKGTFSNGCIVAVKRYSEHLFSSRASDRQAMRKKVKEMGKIWHPNLVSIRGWCFDRQETIIVYDFIPNGSLDKWLFGFGALPWTRRFKVIKDVAEALSYVHSKELAHKNVKTSSVFVDVSFRAVVGDYGFVLSSTESTQFEALVSQKIDVFEFGVLMLEVVSGRGRRSDPGKMDLLDLAWAMHESDEKVKLVDKRMGSVVNVDQANRVLEVGLMCTLNDNKGRPSMEQVVEYLNVEKPVPELPLSRPVSLFPYSSATVLCNGYSCASFK